MDFTFVKFLHVATMFAAVTVGVGSEIVLHRIAHTRNVRVIRGVFAQAPWFERISLLLFGAGVVFGLIATALGIFNFFAPWLLLAYALVVLVGLNGAFILGAWTKKMGAASAASGEDAPSPALEQLIGDTRILVALIVDILLFVAIIYVMITKPGGIQ